MSGWLRAGRPEVRSAKFQLNHVVGGAVTEPFANRTPSIKDDRRCSFVDSLPDGSWSNLASVAA